MEKIGFEILRTRNEDNNFSEKHTEILPPLYKLFSNLFELGDDQFNYDKYFLEEKNKLFHCQVLYYYPRGKDENNITFTHFDTIETVINNWDEKQGYTDIDISQGLLRIGGIALGGGIFIGKEPSNLDQVFVHIWDSDQGIEKLEDNVFEFVKKLRLVPDNESLTGNIKHSQLYKNWNEDFWRIKEQQENGK